MRQYLSSITDTTAVRDLTSRRLVITAPAGSLGRDEAELRSSAISSAISNPIKFQDLAAAKPLFPMYDTGSSLSSKTIASAQRLLALLPEVAFIGMAGGAAAYAATPVHERQVANFRTVCKAVGKDGAAGDKLASLIEKLQTFRRLRGVKGDLWPLYPCILSNFAVWLQLQSPKAGATSVAPRCISIFKSAASSLCLPVLIDSPHLGSVPAHQASGDGWTGFIPLDIMREVATLCSAPRHASRGLVFDARCAYTIWEGSCRVQDWSMVTPHTKSLAPGADAVYKISITKNGERNTLFAVGKANIMDLTPWRMDFDEDLRLYGTTPALSCDDYDSDACVPLEKTALDAKSFSPRMMRLISFCAKKLGYTQGHLRDLHITPHSLHGSMSAYAEALDWDMVPIHRLGRWRLPASPSAAVLVRTRRGAGRGGAKSIPAVYSTAASCQKQLSLRQGMIEVIRTIGANFTTHGDLSCFISNADLDSKGLRGPQGHETAARSALRHTTGLPVGYCAEPPRL